MRRPGAVWLELRRWWVTPLAICLVNLAVLFAYGLVLAGQARFREARMSRQSAELVRLKEERAELVAAVEAAREIREGIDDLYENWLSTERQRLTRLIAEVKSLARRAGLDPTVISYPEESLEQYDLVKRSIVFTVEGTYQDLRRFVNFLELSDYFLTLEEVQLADSGAQGQSLRINLKISTLFAELDEPQDVASTSSGVGS